MGDIRVQVSEKLKNEAKSILNDVGMTMSEAVRIFLKQCINSRGLPFTPHIKKPNAETLLAFKEAEDGDFESFSVKEFTKQLKDLQK